MQKKNDRKSKIYDCGTYVGLVMSVVYDKGIGSPLITSWGKFKKMAKKYDFTPMKWDGIVSNLKRGDILVYKKPTVGSNGAGQHTFIYLGNNLVAEGSRENIITDISKKPQARACLIEKTRKSSS